MTPVWASATLSVCIYHPAMFPLSCQLRTPFSPPGERVNRGDGVGPRGQGSLAPGPLLNVCRASLPPPRGTSPGQRRASAWCRGSRLVIHKCRAIITC